MNMKLNDLKAFLFVVSTAAAVSKAVLLIVSILWT